MGTLVKVKPDGTVGKIGGLPENCIIDNKNRLTIDAVDKSWYIALAKKYISDYVGV
jgi:predicted S18 family serine protease